MSGMRSPSRRRLLAALSTAAAASTAGCSADDDPTTTDETTRTTPTAATTTSSTTTAGETTEPVTDAERVRIAKQVTGDLAAGEFEAVVERFADRFQGDVTAERLSNAWSAYTDALGAYRGASVVEQGERNGYRFVVLRATFESGAVRVVVSFDGERLAGLRLRAVEDAYELPPYVGTGHYSALDLSLSSPACDLGAELVVPDPAIDEPMSALVLVHGSGPNDRNASIGPNQPFKDIALGLVARGVAVLRYDKRTFACDVSRDDGLGLDALTVDDAVTAVNRLRERDDVGPVAVVGHSQGGLAAPRIAKRADADAMAMLAAPGGSLAELVPYQLRYLAELDGQVTASERERIEAAEAAVDRIRAGDVGDDEVLLNFHADFWRDLADYDQTAVAAALDVPRFLAFGGRDWQVPVERARPDWQRALADAENATFRTYEAANHLFIPGEGTPTAAEYYRPGHVTESLVRDLSGWAHDLSR